MNRRRTKHSTEATVRAFVDDKFGWPPLFQHRRSTMQIHMITRFAILLPVLGLTACAELAAQTSQGADKSSQLNFSRLPDDDQVCDWLMSASPTFKDAYSAILRRSYVKGIKFKSVPHHQTEFSEIGVFFVDDTFEIRISNELTGAERVRTLAMEVANAYLNEEHRQIDAAAAKGFFDAREFAIAHEIYEYEAWRVYRQCLFDLEKKLGAGNLPAGLFYGNPTHKVADYKLPPLSEYLQHMEDSQHLKHYLDWFQKYYAKKRTQKEDAEQPEKSN